MYTAVGAPPPLVVREPGQPALRRQAEAPKKKKRKPNKPKHNPDLGDRFETIQRLPEETKQAYLGTDQSGPIAAFNRAVAAPIADAGWMGLQGLGHLIDYSAKGLDNWARETGLSETLRGGAGAEFQPGTALGALSEAFPMYAPATELLLTNAATKAARATAPALRSTAKVGKDMLADESGVLFPRLYHGTHNKNFNRFESPNGKAVWLAEDENLAKTYADRRRVRAAEDGRVVTAEADIENPIEVPNDGYIEDPVKWAQEKLGIDLSDTDLNYPMYVENITRHPATAAKLREKGYDAIGLEEGGSKTWGLLNPDAARITHSGLPVSPNDFAADDLSPLLGRDDWAIMTAENPMARALSAEENAALNQQFLADVEAQGLKAYPALGMYGNPENSYLLSGSNRAGVQELVRKYDQESALTNTGLLYGDGSTTPALGIRKLDQQPEDFYTTIETPNGPVHFTVDLATDDAGNLRKIAPPQQRPSAPALSGIDGRPGEGYSNPSLISTRLPSKANYAVQGDPDAELLLQTGQSLRDAPLALENNMALLRQEPFMQGFNGTAQEIFDEAVQRGSDNMRFIAEDLMDPKLVDSSRGWYDFANRLADELATKHGISREQASGVLAALSPQNHWANNVANAEQLIEMWRNGFDGGSAAGAQARNLVGGMLSSGRDKNSIALLGPDEAARIIETPMYLLSETERRHKVAMLGELNYDRSIPDILPDGTRVPDTHTSKWGSGKEIGSALRILEGEGVGGVLRGGGKVPSFYNNIVDPHAPLPIVTADTHHAGAFSLFPGGGGDTVVKMTLGNGAGSNSAVTGAKGIYGLVTDATADAAGKLDMLPRELQSVVWEGVRNLWGGPGVKTPALKKAAVEAWMSSANPQAARNAIKDLLRR